jgi:formylglycine-generating enzyme required for sulfatase activity
MHPVGTLKPNDLGLFDMHGNAEEWCLETDEREEKRKARGGAFDQSGLDCQSTHRNWLAPTYHDYDVGFRPVRTFR